MKLEDVYRLSKSIAEHKDTNISMDVSVYLNEAQHENMQQEVFRIINNGSMQGYRSENEFQISLLDILFVFKLKSTRR